MSIATTILNEICDVLETSDGRDKVLRSLCYIAKLSTALSLDELHAKRLQRFSSQMSGARNILQLLDDIPMLKNTLEYGFGHEEPEVVMAVIGVLRNAVDHIGYTIEKVTWLSDANLISLNNGKSWNILNSLCKIISIYLNFMRTARYILFLRRKIYSDTQLKIQNVAYERLEWLTIIRLLLDFTHAVNSLPPGFLWSSKLNTLNVGTIGTVSSILSVLQIFIKRAVKSKYRNENGLF